MTRSACAASGTAILAFLVLVWAGTAPAGQDIPSSQNLLAASRQAVFVVAEGWNSPRAELAAFEREEAGGPWRPAEPAAPALLGRNGLAWGAGFDEAANPADPRKQEGDGRAPAGIFRIGTAFGYGPAESAAFLRLPYIPLDKTWKCIDDPRSLHYNRIVRKTGVARPNRTGCEEMLLEDHRYRWGAFVEYNSDPPRPGRGSCIFLHIWLDPATPTSGCTALDEERLLRVLRWLRPKANPVLVQLPRHEYVRLREFWRLP